MPNVEDNDLLREFQQRRSKMLRYFALSMILIIVSLVLLQFSDQGASFLGIERRLWRVFATSQFLAAMAFAVIGFNQYRCPYCGEVVRGHDRYYMGVVTNPEKCPNCRKRLK